MKKLNILLIIVLILALIRACVLISSNDKNPSLQNEVIEKNEVLKQSILYETGSNYLDKTFYGGKIARWNKAEFPIKVYIEDLPSMPNYYKKAFEEAAKIWENEGEGIIKIAFVDREKEANIVFKTKDRQENIRKISNDEPTTLAFTKPTFDKDKFKKAEIIFFRKNIDGSMVKPYEVLNIAVHEFGHALGIWGHSDDKNSVMYVFYDPKYKKRTAFLNKQDKATLKLLYMVTPDFTNGNKKDEKDTINASILIGTSDERIEKSIKEAKKEVEMKKGDCLSRLNLAALYEQKKDYNMMYFYIKEAEQTARNQNEMHNVYVSYAIYYASQNDKQKALNYMEKALEIKKTKELVELYDFIKTLH